MNGTFPVGACWFEQQDSIEDGTLMRWWAPRPDASSSSRSPFAPNPSEPLWCAAQVPDVSWLFVACLNPKRGLSDDDYRLAAQRLGTDVAAVKAVAEVETVGAAFDPEGRPAILYERHIFERLTGSRYSTGHPRVSGPALGPAQYGPRSRQYEKLAEAYALDPWAALQSASWGSFQVLGENYAMLDYASPQHMAQSMARSEKAHLDAFVSYVRGTPKCLQAIQRKDWATFARWYNGPDYKTFHYDKSIAEAYARQSAAEVQPAAKASATPAPGPRLP